MNTTISISKETRHLLQEFGRKSESYDNIIRRMYNEIQLRDQISEFTEESGYSSLDEAEQWTKLKIKAMKKDD